MFEVPCSVAVPFGRILDMDHVRTCPIDALMPATLNVGGLMGEDAPAKTGKTEAPIANR